jgi:VanZ family protein
MNRLKFWFPSIIIMLLIFLGSNDPSSGEKSDFITRFIWKAIAFFTGQPASPAQEAATTFVIRKLAHMSEYLLLFLAYFYAINKTYFNNVNSTKKDSGRSQNYRITKLVLAAFLAFLYSVSDEFHQTFVPGRVGTYEDVLIDSVGILTGYLLLNFKIFIFRKI